MAVCNFFLQGRCKFGSGCKYEHPGDQTQYRDANAGRNTYSNQHGHGGRSGDFRNANFQGRGVEPNANRFSAFQSPNDRSGNFQPRGHGYDQNSNRYSSSQNQGDRSGHSQRGGPSSGKAKHYIDPAIIRYDLTKDKPEYPFSAYSPHQMAEGEELYLPARQLFGGPDVEWSAEELRVAFYMAQAAGNPQTIVQAEADLLQRVEQQKQAALNDLQGAARYVGTGKNEHPNRWDACKNESTGVFARSARPKAGFGQPSAFGSGQQATSFGQRGFGQPPIQNAPAQLPAFSRPSGFAPQPSFGQVSGFGQSPFGQASNPGQTSAGGFGQPSMLGQNQNTSPFQPANSSPFAAPAPTIAMQDGTNASVAMEGMQSPGPFNSGFNTFGAPSGPTTTGFGQPSDLSNRIGVFGQPAAPSGSSGFGRPSPFQNAAAQQTNGGLSQAQTNGGFGQPQANGAFGQPTTNGTSLGGGTVRGPNNRLTMWKGRRVDYVRDKPYYHRPDDNSRERIWFPNGPPAKHADCELPPDQYTVDIQNAYLYCQQNGQFQGGLVPEAPPMKDWINWDI